MFLSFRRTNTSWNFGGSWAQCQPVGHSDKRFSYGRSGFLDVPGPLFPNILLFSIVRFFHFQDFKGIGWSGWSTRCWLGDGNGANYEFFKEATDWRVISALLIKSTSIYLCLMGFISISPLPASRNIYHLGKGLIIFWVLFNYFLAIVSISIFRICWRVLSIWKSLHAFVFIPFHTAKLPLKCFVALSFFHCSVAILLFKHLFEHIYYIYETKLTVHRKSQTAPWGTINYFNLGLITAKPHVAQLSHNVVPFYQLT